MVTLAEPEDLLLFTPVPMLRYQAKGWTADRQIAFIKALASTGVVKNAADSVGMTARSAYALRDRARATAGRLVDVPLKPDVAETLGPGFVFSFAAAWDLALRHGLALQMESALPYAIEPEKLPVVRRGQIVGWQEKFNARLANNALAAWRRQEEGVSFDHEIRIMQRIAHFAEVIERRDALGPARWPEAPSDAEPMAAPVPPDRRDGFYPDGEVRGGLLDPDGPADQPPRRPPPSAKGKRRSRAT